MKYKAKRKALKPFIHFKNNIVFEINNELVSLVGYSSKELFGKSICEVNIMFRIDFQIYLENIEDEHNCYIFTKGNEPREVTISCKRDQSGNEQIYFIKEKFNSRIEDRLFLLNSIMPGDVLAVAVYSIPNGILLKANKKYLATSIENTNMIGKPINEVLYGFKGSIYEDAFKDVIKTGNPFYSKETKYEHPKKGKTYWDESFFPIHIKGELKYIVNTSTDVTERVVSRRLVEEQKQDLEAIIENMSGQLVRYDKDSNLSLINNISKKPVYNIDFIKKVSDTFNLAKCYDSEGNLLTKENFPLVKVLNGEKLKEYLLIVDKPEGRLHYSINGSPIYDKGGSVKSSIFCVHDVTKLVNASAMIKKQKEELETIMENMSDALIIINKDAEVIKINKSARDNITFDYKTNKIEDIFRFGKVYDIYDNLILFDDLPFNRVIRGEKLVNFSYIIKNNNKINYREVNGTPIYDSEGNFIAGVLIFCDITEKLKYERNLYIKAQYDSLSNIIENLDLGFARYTYPEFNFIDINNKGYNQLKQIFPSISSQSHIKSQNLFDIFDGKVHIIDELVQASLKISRKSCFKISKYNLDHQEVFVKWIYQPLFDLNNELIEIIVFGIDITEEIKDKKKMEKVLKIQDEVYANISHELRTPLNVIFSANQMMDVYLKNDLIEGKKEKLYHYNNIIKQNCYRLTKLINNVVDLSKSNSGLLKLNLTNENVVGIVENIIQSVSDYVKSRELSIIFDTEVEEKIIACDPDMIERVMLNLISNAIKFSNPNGVIYVNVIEKGDVVEISVKDTGEGIEKKHLELIFQRFFQADKSLSRNAEGTGIGLSLIKSIVELHGGNISVESEVDKGSTFKVEFPARIMETQKAIEQTNYMNDKIEMLNVEFSDIYSND